MPQPCTVCHHPRLEDINTGLVSGIPRLRLARQFGLKEPAVRYHAGRHLPEHLGLARHASQVAKADKLLDRVRRIAGRLESVMNKAEASNDSRTMLLAARELRPWLELLGKLGGPASQAASPTTVGDPHELAKEAERYLGWYGQHFSAQEQGLTASGKGQAFESLGPNDLIELDVPDDFEDPALSAEQ